MKTFRDILQSSNDNDILKSYKINDATLSFTSKQFKGLSNEDCFANSFFTNVKQPTIVGTLKKIKENIISVTVKYSCSECEGTGEIDCESCDGTGECDCDKCGQTHDCGDCRGKGYYDCEKCIKNPYDEDAILFYTEINLNQGELFY